MSTKRPLTATILAAHISRSCDLYISNVYHNRGETPRNVSEFQKAHFLRGMTWEAQLFNWLDNENLLLQVLSAPIKGAELLEHISLDDRDHFFISNLSFYAPMEHLRARYGQEGFDHVEFGLTKPDLLEITRIGDTIQWKVIDAKSSQMMKASHIVQIYLYTEWLDHILSSPPFVSSGSAGIWLPPKGANGIGLGSTVPSLDDIHDVQTILLKSSLDDYIFRMLPQVLGRPKHDLEWHLNPLCKGCPYFPGCSSASQREGRTGLIPNLNLDSHSNLKSILNIKRREQAPPNLSDIEDLASLPKDEQLLERLQISTPALLRKVLRILAVPRKGGRESPVALAAKTQQVMVIPQLSYTVPKEEDVAIILSLVLDPSLDNQGLCSFAASVLSSIPSFAPASVAGHSQELVPSIASIIRAMIKYQVDHNRTLRAQFYTFSSGEALLLEKHLISTALCDRDAQEDIALCISALAEGASLLQTTFQPLIFAETLEFALNVRASKPHLQSYLSRLGLSTEGTLPDLRDRITREIKRLKAESGGVAVNQRTEFGQLPKLVILQKEISRLLALPFPGFWNLPQCVSVLVPGCPIPETDEKTFETYRTSTPEYLASTLFRRNTAIFAVLTELRRRVSSYKLLVNESRKFSVNFMDICHQSHLRKLMYMEQFEVLAKLTKLWQARIESSPDAPILTYLGPSGGRDHEFILSSGSLDVAPDKARALYDYLLCLDDGPQESHIPVEALYDDLSLSGIVFPLNQWTRGRWNAQSSEVRKNLLVVDVHDLLVRNDRTVVILKVWNNGILLSPNRQYRLSPRFVDFNITKVFSSLMDMDLKFSACNEDERSVPFIHLILDPRGFSTWEDVDHTHEEVLKAERQIQRAYRELHSLDVPGAGSLLLKPSQRKATKRILTARLAVIWGPPGTGKTYTLALSLLRLINVERNLGSTGSKIIMVTAMTHAALDAFMKKLEFLVQCTMNIDSLDRSWLDSFSVERIRNGSEHPAPVGGDSKTTVYVGTVYQLYNFSKKHTFQVDCLMIDEAGQMTLCASSLPFKNLGRHGRVVIAGDSEQLAPIVAGTYPETQHGPLFGSILSYVLHSAKTKHMGQPPNLGDSHPLEQDSSQSTVVQLTENFRLNPDLGEFVSTIYSRKFEPQKSQARELAHALASIQSQQAIEGALSGVSSDAQTFLVALSNVMLKGQQRILRPPSLKTPQEIPTILDDTHLPVSLALIELETWRLGERGKVATEYEAHVKGEAMLGACLATWLQRAGSGEDIFVATPHRAQRRAVKDALAKIEEASLTAALEDLSLDGTKKQDPIKGNITVDTVERLQGSEAGFVICLFSVPQGSTGQEFLLERRRLNVAISRARTLCITIVSKELLRAPLRILAKEETRKGHAFLKAFEERSWKGQIGIEC